MKKVKLFFPREMKYGDRVFEGGKVHEISEEKPGFINRWIMRGCIEEKEEELEELDEIFEELDELEDNSEEIAEEDDELDLEEEEEE